MNGALFVLSLPLLTTSNGSFTLDVSTSNESPSTPLLPQFGCSLLIGTLIKPHVLCVVEPRGARDRYH